MALNHNKKFLPWSSLLHLHNIPGQKKEKKNQKISRHYLDQAYRIEGDKEHKKKLSFNDDLVLLHGEIFLSWCKNDDFYL